MEIFQLFQVLQFSLVQSFQKKIKRIKTTYLLAQFTSDAVFKSSVGAIYPDTLLLNGYSQIPD